MELVFNKTTLFRNITVIDNQSWLSLLFVRAYLSTYLEMFLAVFFISLIATLTGQRNLTKLACALGFTRFKNNTRIPSVSLLMIMKCIYRFGADYQKIVEMAVEHYGENFKINFLGLYETVFITNPIMVQKLLMSSKPEHLHKPKLYDYFTLGEMKNGLLTLPPDIWKTHRSAISKAFTYNGLLRQLNIFEEHAKRFVLTLREDYISIPCSSKEPIPIDEEVDKLTFDVISHIAAGKQVYYEENVQFRAEFERLKELMSYRLTNFVYWPDIIWNLNPKKKELDRVQDNILCYWSMIIAEIRKQFDVDAKNAGASDDDMAGKSLVELMINARLSNKEIFIELLTFLFGGHETTSSTTKLLFFLLASHKNYQEKCRMEIDQMFEQMCDSGSNEISMEALNSLTFLDMCVKECLRLYALVPLFGRQLEASLQLDENTVLLPGTTVYTTPHILHRNSKIYPEPKKFDPERFSAENVKNRGLGEFIPFSLGPRNCIGYKSAMIELKVITAYVIHNFEVHTEMTIAKLDQLFSKRLWPHPKLGITISPRN